MTWTKLSDDFSDECWGLSDGAFRLLVELLNYSNRKLLDGVIPLSEFRRFARNDERDLPELVAGGWVARDDEAVSLVFHAQWQATREKQLAVEHRAQQNGRKGGRPRKSAAATETQDVTHDETQTGFPSGSSSAAETQNETQQLTQNETQGVWSGLGGSLATDDAGTRGAQAREAMVNESTGEVVELASAGFEWRTIDGRRQRVAVRA